MTTGPPCRLIRGADAEAPWISGLFARSAKQPFLWREEAFSGRDHRCGKAARTRGFMRTKSVDGMPVPRVGRRKGPCRDWGQQRAAGREARLPSLWWALRPLENLTQLVVLGGGGKKKGPAKPLLLVGVKALGRPYPTYCPRGSGINVTLSPYESPTPPYESASRMDFLHPG